MMRHARSLLQTSRLGQGFPAMCGVQTRRRLQPRCMSGERPDPVRHPSLEPLKDMLESSTARFCCGGVTPLPGPVRIYYDGAHGPARIDFPGSAGDELQQLVAAGEPATFGRGAEDVLDPEYRRASKIGAAQFAIGGFSPQDVVLDEVRRIMAPEAAGLRAELHGLSVYSAGGLFKPHADTPRGETHIGSLAVCLAAPFAGGALAVRHGGVEVSFDWAAASAANRLEVQWCAFYSDVEHEVLPVTSGHRVTLAYDLFIQPGGKKLQPPGSALCTDTLSVMGVLRKMLADASFYPEGVKLGFGCSHKYPTMLSGKRTEPLPAGLKGTDRVLFAAATALGLQVSLASYLKERDVDRDYGGFGRDEAEEGDEGEAGRWAIAAAPCGVCRGLIFRLHATLLVCSQGRMPSHRPLQPLP